MTEKQKAFVEELLRSGNGDAALLHAEYLPPWTVERVLAIRAVQQYLIEQVKQHEADITACAEVADQTEVAAFFSAVMRGSPAADEKKPGIKEQLRAAELLAKHFGMFKGKEDMRPGEGEEIEFVGDEEL